MITTQHVRIILDRNRNGLDGLPRAEAGATLSRGLYWDTAMRRVVAVEAPQSADRPLVQLTDDPTTTFDELVRRMAMGGGGRSGQALPYHSGAGAAALH